MATVKIIPTIIPKDFEEIEEYARKIEPFFDWLQLDIMDGKFVPSKTFLDLRKLRGLETKLKLELHLMAKAPEDFIEEARGTRIKRFIFHREVVMPEMMPTLIRRLKQESWEVGIALNPETPIYEVEPFLKDLDLVLLMSVFPGFGGQKFLPKSTGKIQALKETWQSGRIEIDGGINPETAENCLRAGANILAVGSYLSEAEDFKKALDDLRRIILKVQM